MSKKMLIDARHPEETRVALLSQGKVEDFDFESQSRMPLRGNIYLARITRVEPSLQAAFVEYGGNRHGFLAFSEIHPDYYQIPVSDRDVLREAEALEAELADKLAALDQITGDDVDDDDDQETSAEAAEATSDEDETPRRRGKREERSSRGRRGGRGRRSRKESADAAAPAEGAGEIESADTGPSDTGPSDTGPSDTGSGETGADAGDHSQSAQTAATQATSTEGADSADAEAPAKPAAADDTPTSGDDEGPTSAALSAKTPPALTQDLDEDADVATPEDAPQEGADEATAEQSIDAEANDDAPADNAAEDAAEPEAASDNERADEEGAEAPQEAEEDANADAIEDEEPAPEAKKELTEEEVAAREQAAEIADLKARYDAARRQREKLLRNYRIQEVIKRRQILLVQVVKEERGNKGAALTTYMSLAGRYGVLMPNNARGGGVSRKITNAGDRKRLRSAMKDLSVPKGQGLIIRTAGAKRTKAEIKRDYDYLARLWETIRDQTMKSVAPCLIYEEASLIKRAIRDLYDKDTDEILVEGETGYREAKDFMKMLMPSHAKNVQPYREKSPLFLRHDVDRQLDEMYQPVVTLKSGGYLVIQQTEALISIDVNSGKATKERNVEATALKTNSEAAVEVARQCRLRDLAGLVVIDFIDMDENRNNRAVEKKLKDAMKMDRARIQIGSISSFGLMEMSRQRRRSGIVDGTTRACPTCDGAGAVRSAEMAALRVLRAVEEAAVKDRAGEVTATTCHEVALYILNQKRSYLNRIEDTYKISVAIMSDHEKAGDQFDITKRGRAPSLDDSKSSVVEFEAGTEPAEDATADDSSADAAPAAETATETDGEYRAEGGEGGEKKRRRRRRRRKSEGDDADTTTPSADEASSTESGTAETSTAEGTEGDNAEAAPGTAEKTDGDDDDSDGKKRRRRGRRGGRRGRKRDGDEATSDAPDAGEDAQAAPQEPVADATTASPEVDPVPEAAEDTPPVMAETAQPDPVGEDAVAEEPLAAEPVPEMAPAPKKPDGPKRGGWWQRAFNRD